MPPPTSEEEEKLLTLQMENRRLKKEAMERDDKLKQTLARMARAEARQHAVRTGPAARGAEDVRVAEELR